MDLFTLKEDRKEPSGWMRCCRSVSLKIERVPAPLHRVASFGAEGRASLEPDQKNRWATCFAAIETTPEESRFGIVVVGCE